MDENTTNGVQEIEISSEPEIVLRNEIGIRVEDYWCDTIISSEPFKWYQISKQGNKIIIQPVQVTPL